MKKTFAMKTFWLFLLALSFLGCGKKSNPVAVPITAGPLYPLTLGSTWVHLYNVYDTAGTITSSYYDTTTVFNETVIQGQRWAYLRSSYGGDTLLWALKSDGVWISAIDGTPFLLFKYPVKRFDSYRIPLTNVDSIIVDGADFTQVFPLGLFEHCYQYRIEYMENGSSPWNYISHTYAANIGPVDILFYTWDPVRLGEKATLVYYKIK